MKTNTAGYAVSMHVMLKYMTNIEYTQTTFMEKNFGFWKLL